MKAEAEVSGVLAREPFQAAARATPRGKNVSYPSISAPFCWYDDKEGSCELIMYKLTKSKCMLRVREEDVEG